MSFDPNATTHQTILIVFIIVLLLWLLYKVYVISYPSKSAFVSWQGHGRLSVPTGTNQGHNMVLDTNPGDFYAKNHGRVSGFEAPAFWESATSAAQVEDILHEPDGEDGTSGFVSNAYRRSRSPFTKNLEGSLHGITN